ncbi:MAG: hypothetical protein J0I47_03200 [Sphingomonas sp.]|uniref:hypothetical protein n=1 Tax=Sphingomonas sp. TaxID=28214 RepID=UPI001AD46D3F|nr:hypothetical protein [Sphingomonas sp.]MBN8807234.1 hypothetical protein [Sphingomonas sp.]
MKRALTILAWFLAPLPVTAATAPAAAPAQRIVSAIDPLLMANADFVRLADPQLWTDLNVTRIEFRDGRTFWRFYRIRNLRHPAGPLWFVPHDNENAAFQAAIYAVRAYGGEVVAIEEARSIAGPDSRGNGDVDYGKDVDPNRNFWDATPAYADEILAGLGHPPRLIVALHTNEPGFDASEYGCGPPPSGNTGRGEISVLFCNDVYSPRPSVSARWPFDDTDSVAIVSYPAQGSPADGFCARALAEADANIQFEHVVTSDGSLSNYALFHGLPYVNFETQERGITPEGLGDARTRLLAMIDLAMMRCAPVEGVTLQRVVRPPPHGRKRR